jgi:hypothetical protein
MDALSGWVANHPLEYAIAAAVLCYLNLGTDINFAISLHDCSAEEGSSLDQTLVWVTVGTIFLAPVVLSLVDVLTAGGRGWFGVLLNLTHTRVLMGVVGAVGGRGDAGGDADNKKKSRARAAARELGDIKLFETLFEAIPQLIIQLVVLLHYSCECSSIASTKGFTSLYFSIAISALSSTFALVSKFTHILDMDGDTTVVAASWVYFCSDGIARAIAISMFLGTFGGAAVGVAAAGLLLLDLVVQHFSQCKSENWDVMEEGKCGCRCCWDTQDRCCQNYAGGNSCGVMGDFPFMSAPVGVLIFY